MKSPILRTAGIFSIALPFLLLLGGCKSDESTTPEPKEKAPTEQPTNKAEPAPAAPAKPKKEEPKTAEAKPKMTPPAKPDMKDSQPADKGKTEVITIGGGCFWCTEAVLEQIDGVIDVVSGYMGGTVDSPTYEQVCTGRTGHAEVIQVTFDPAKVTLDDILDIFWQAHDPTTLNRQGADRGTQYRSVIFYSTPEQKNIAEKSKARIGASGAYPDAVVTEITKASTFWPAEDYHQDYYRNNKSKNQYCPIVIAPKLRKLGLKE